MVHPATVASSVHFRAHIFDRCGLATLRFEADFRPTGADAESLTTDLLDTSSVKPAWFGAVRPGTARVGVVGVASVRCPGGTVPRQPWRRTRLRESRVHNEEAGTVGHATALVRRAAAGGLAGAAATVPMTGWMLAGQLTGRHGEQSPKRLVRVAARRLGLPARRRGTGTLLSYTAAHLAFGAGCGTVYSVLTRRSSAARGAAFGLAVWAVSYAGWVPALRFMPPPTRDVPRRAWTTMTAHLVYGMALGAGLDRMRSLR
jgi:hypothetical protein